MTDRTKAMDNLIAQDADLIELMASDAACYLYPGEDQQAERAAYAKGRAEQAAEIERLRAAISWIEPPFIDEKTPEAELRSRIGFCVADARRAALGESHD